MSLFQFKYGLQTKELSIPEENLLGVLYPNESAISQEGAEIRRALQKPIGAKRLAEMIDPQQKVAIMVSDITRPSPTKKLLPPLLEELGAANVLQDKITIVFGMGTHRLHTPEEQKALVGESIYENYRCVDSTAEDDYVSYGLTKLGTPIEICRSVAEADFRICTGNVEYHYCAGYSGGAKAIMPGASSRRSIEVHHALQLMPEARIGKVEGNPFREDMEEIGAKVGIDFILNVVLNQKKEIVQAVAGDARLAHLEACAKVDSMYGIEIGSLADIVVVSAGGYPKDLNVYQAHKALENAQYAVKRGGIIILTAECKEGAGNDTFRTWMREADTLDAVLDRLREKFMMGGHKAAAVARILKRAQVYAVTSLPAADLKELFMVPKSSLEEALADALAEKGRDATIWVMPYGGSTLPRLREN
ncbi:MAG: nickel-dependent malate racemase, LarAH6 family [Desulfitobacteriaceae bacterium]